ncbi:hypothetical protein BMH32_00245 [Leucobacter sp. OLJS4]|uniref:DUF3710 domain-containing protein n=1 Tax=unclassified Leucobacter TaxID=2621730 RepID=UPI000C1906C6|nr:MULTISPECIES: DUF3710 domain-containing protein [unclassified Leucobacter]PII81448.1 hypothetical protein BMH25_12960 [Leucobacter sp. OLCALW19]PII86118.1 hypothetical protein BMH26_13380 [Leucobacter sp. OLTLW20]PII90013.1 hypothetical protein BMH27_11545 [Leucobacter sp. OLAS13]PII97046.1 hypothetical protein BMH29_12230 [Leucobacter sp. OLDS2]PIJ02260.1 hypothetical protein BMH31_12650 [Leucobacter sp. OLIS6]
MSDETPQNESNRNADELELHEAAAPEVDDAKSAPVDRETAGPYDASEVPAMRPYVDLGGIKVAPREGLQLRLEVDERAQRVVAVSLEYADSLLQVQAFSAPKTTGLWHEVRTEIAQQLGSQGAEVAHEDGDLGPELLVRSAGTNEQEVRLARFVGVDGPRWLLRGVIMGRAAADADAKAQIVELFRELVVVRGDDPMPPSELLELKVPAGLAQGEAGVQQA